MVRRCVDSHADADEYALMPSRSPAPTLPASIRAMPKPDDVHYGKWNHCCPTCQRVIRWALTFCVFCAERGKNPPWENC